MTNATQTTIRNAFFANEIAILIRRAGGSAYVEREGDADVIRTNRSLSWVRRVCRAAHFSPPSA